MPELPVLDANGKLGFHALMALLSIMSKPNEPAIADHIVIGAVIEVESGSKERGFFSGHYRSALDRISGDPFGGCCAGETLLYYLTMAVHHPKEASLNRAWFMTHRENANTTRNNGTRVTTTLRSVQRYWSEYRNVAHLWAVHRMNSDYKVLKEDNEINEFLLTSEALLEIALVSGLSLGKDPWRLPSEYPRQSVEIVIHHSLLKDCGPSGAIALVRIKRVVTAALSLVSKPRTLVTILLSRISGMS